MHSWQFAFSEASRTQKRVTSMIVAAAIVSSGVAFAQNPPNPRPGATTPVQVQNTKTNPVPVTGEVNVAVLNDIVSTPYLVSHSQSFVGGDATQFEFDVPDGMRLIVETITIRFALQAAGNALIQFGVKNATGVVEGGELSVQQQGTIVDAFGDSLTWLVGTHATKLRVDARAGRDDELILFPRLSLVNGTANAFVGGYLVPIQ